MQLSPTRHSKWHGDGSDRAWTGSSCPRSTLQGSWARAALSAAELQEQTLHPSSCFIPPLCHHGQANSCVSTIRRAVRNEEWGWGGMLKPWGKYLWWQYKALKYLEVLSPCTPTAQLLCCTCISILPSSLEEIASGEWKNNTPIGQLCLLCCTSRCWGLISDQKNRQNFNFWIQLQNQRQQEANLLRTREQGGVGGMIWEHWASSTRLVVRGGFKMCSLLHGNCLCVHEDNAR